ncbi:hypothetical protein PanWU01x14_064710 [Parasponia andersonii]|uniref:Uncharacterized protein n=1 Tax=Parasponia andersonii TaxID=3476 RepID=A0A2P5DHH5_PARAD|nr:hypothetical protein PanWU01x14_064710 [Parasponia andersonii]
MELYSYPRLLGSILVSLKLDVLHTGGSRRKTYGTGTFASCLTLDIPVEWIPIEKGNKKEHCHEELEQ